MIQPAQFLALAAMLFSVGLAGFILRRNALVMFMSVELMLNAVNLTLITFAKMHGNIDGQVLAFFIIAVAAPEVVVGLALIVLLFRRAGHTDVDTRRMLKW